MLLFLLEVRFVTVDSEYDLKEFILIPAAGALAGVSGAILMLGLVFLLQPLFNISVTETLQRFGSMFFPGSGTDGAEVQLWVGMALHLFVGIVLGLLYAISQQRIGPGYMIGVGFFYGVVIWVVSSLIIGIFSETIRTTTRSLPWFLSCLVYGLSLAAFAVMADRQRPREAQIVPKD
jgi:hypothetical protein